MKSFKFNTKIEKTLGEQQKLFITDQFKALLYIKKATELFEKGRLNSKRDILIFKRTEPTNM